MSQLMGVMRMTPMTGLRVYNLSGNGGERCAFKVGEDWLRGCVSFIGGRQCGNGFLSVRYKLQSRRRDSIQDPGLDHLVVGLLLGRGERGAWVADRQRFPASRLFRHS